MVWVIEGPFKGSITDNEGEYPAATSHYLRPSRDYKLGAVSYTRVGTDGKSLTNRQRLQDFELKLPSIPKDGLWVISTGEWTDEMAVDHPDSPTNLAPYTLSITSSKPLTREQQSEKEALAPNVAHELRDGDRIFFLKSSVRWVPIILCVANATAPKKAAFLKHAQSLGFKLAYKTFLAHHTHLLVKNLGSTSVLLKAAMHLAHVASPAFIDELALRGMPIPYPAGFPTIPPGAISVALEKTIVGIDPTCGYDVRRFWKHSILEDDWTALPPATSPAVAPEVDRHAPDLTTQVWNPNHKRSTLFKGILLLSFRIESADEEELVKLGGGTFFSGSGLIKPGAQLATLVSAFDIFKREQSIPDDVRLAILPPLEEGEDGEPPNPVLRAFANSLGVSTYIGDQAFIDAIAKVDSSTLFGPILSPVPTPPSPQQSNSGALFVPATAIPSTAGPAPTPAGTFPEIGGTHPEERVSAPRGPSVAQQGSTDAGPPGEQPQAAVPVVRKLTRRAKTGTTLESFFGDVAPAPVPEPESRPPHTQIEAPELNVNSSQATEMDVDISYTAPPVRKLKRRVATQSGESVASLFDYTPAPPTQVAKKARTEAIPEEDEDDAGTQLSNNNDTGPVAGPSTTRKRGASEAVGSGDETAAAKTSAAATGRKKARASESSPEPAPAATAAAAKGKKAAPTPAKGKKGAAAKKADKDKDKAADDGLLRVKTTKRKGAEADQGFNDDFNALKIVRPTLQPMKAQKGRRLGWNEHDADEELERLIREDQEREQNPEEWGGQAKEQGMFVVELVSMVRKNRPQPKEADPDGKYAGRANFKKFRSKDSNAPAGPRPVREPIKYTLAENADFGLGAAHKEKPKKPAPRRPAADEDDDAFVKKGTQTKLNFGAKAKGKGKAKAVLTLDSGSEDAKPDAMDVDDDASDISQTLTKAPAKKKAPAAKPPVKKAPPKKKATKFVDNDDSDDSDGGLTFKGFGKRKR
ncbi:hypothetical protein RQP46_003862 [Phenoliferia psychrophenolica]